MAHRQLSEIDCKGEYQGRFKVFVVLPNGAAEIITAKPATSSNFGIYIDKVDSEAFQCMVAINIGKVECVVRYLLDDFSGSAT